MSEWEEILVRKDLGLFHPFVEECSARADTRHSVQFIPMRCNWRIAIENALEDVHVPHVHPESIAKLKIERLDMERHGRHSIALYKIGNERIVRSLNALSRHFEFAQPAQYFHLFIFPYTCISSVAGLTFSIQQYLPAGSETMLRTSLYSGKRKAGAPDMTHFFDEASRFNKQVFQEDEAMCRRIHIRALREPVNPALRRLAWFTEALEA